MKKLSSICKFLFIILAIISCEDDNSENVEYPPLEKFNYRIVAIKKYGDEFYGESKFQYTGNNLTYYSDSLVFFDESPSYILTEYNMEYPDDKQILGHVDNYFSNGTLISGNTIITISNNRIKEVINEACKIIYSYNSSGQILTYKLYLNDGDWILKNTITYTYSSGRLVKWESENTDETFMSEKIEYSYNGIEVKESIKYKKSEGIWDYSRKNIYTFSSGDITRIDYYKYLTNNWVLKSYCVFEYDTYGNLTEKRTYDGVDESLEYREVYTYEEESGNFRQISNLIGFPAEETFEPIPY